MKFVVVLAFLSVLVLAAHGADDAKKTAKKQLQIGIKKKVENCQRTSKKGDSLTMHYTGKLGLNQYSLLKLIMFN